MAEQVNVAQELVNLLNQHREEIVLSWSLKARELHDARYRHFSNEIVMAWASNGLRNVIKTIKSGPTQEVEDYLMELTSDRLGAGFDISDVIKGFLLSREVITPLILHADAKNLGNVNASISALDHCLRYLIGRFGDLYAEAVHVSLIQETQKRLMESESLQRTTTALLQKLTLDEVLEIVCSETCRLTSASGSAVLLIEDEGWLQVSISIGNPLPVLDRVSVEDSLAGKAVQQGKPWLTNEPGSQIQVYHRNPNLESLLVIPLQAKGVFIGALDVVNKPGGFTDEDIQIMTIFGSQAAIAIENARLHKQAEELAVIQERQRIARELHDSVTQSLYSVSLYADAARLALAAGKQSVVNNHLEELKPMIHEAMLDMRLLIFELHPPILEKEGLVAALRARLEAVESRSGFETTFQVEGERRLPISIETEIYRIAQEALTNVVKHANAQEVRVHLHFDDRQFCMDVWDNGVGFDKESIDHSGGLGLRGIRERVGQLGGSLTIDSLPGEGTTLQILLEI